jgi:hypothetical protein
MNIKIQTYDNGCQKNFLFNIIMPFRIYAKQDMLFDGYFAISNKVKSR